MPVIEPVLVSPPEIDELLINIPRASASPELLAALAAALAETVPVLEKLFITLLFLNCTP